MKIKVCNESGEVETLEFIGPLVVHEGKRLNYIRSHDGLDHYFTFEGDYDGWGTGCRRLLRDDAQTNMEMVDNIEAMRQIEAYKKEERT